MPGLTSRGTVDFGGLTTRLAKKENEPNRIRFRHQNRDGPALEDPNFLHREVTSTGPNQPGLGEASPFGWLITSLELELERGTAVEADTGDAGDCEFDRQHVALLVRTGSHWVHGGRHPPRCRERSRRRSGQQPRRPCRTIGKSCSWPLLVLSLPIASFAAPRRVVEPGFE